MRLSDLPRPRLDNSRLHIRRRQPDAYERTFRLFIAALKVGDEQQVMATRDELRRLVKEEDRQ